MRVAMLDTMSIGGSAILIEGPVYAIGSQCPGQSYDIEKIPSRVA